LYLKTFDEAHIVGQTDGKVTQTWRSRLDWSVRWPGGWLVWTRKWRQCNGRVVLCCPCTLGTKNWAASDTRGICRDDGSPIVL